MIRRRSIAHPKRRTRGFTLIEVLLVLVILVVLASMAVVGYSSIRKKMMKDSARTQIGLLEHAVEVYEQTVGTLPSNLDALIMQPADAPPGKWSGPYLNKGVPPDPWGKPYNYQVPGQHNSPEGFEISTTAPDGEEISSFTQPAGAR